MQTYQVNVHSDHYVTPVQRNAAVDTLDTNVPATPPRTFEPKVVRRK